MKTLFLLIISITSTIWSTHSDSLKYAHMGDYNFMHKSMLIDKSDYEECILTLAYYYYKQDEIIEMQACFDHLSLYLDSKSKD